MANFFDKIGEIAKTAADKTGDMIEIGKLNSKISTEQANILALKQKIGGYYYEHFDANESLPPEVYELCGQIKQCEEAIISVQKEIGTLKGEAPTADTVKCPSCGAANAFGTKFCGSCGTKL